MSKLYREYEEEKKHVLDTLDKLEMSVRFLSVWVNEPMGLENAKYVLEKNSNRTYNLLDENMVKDLLEEVNNESQFNDEDIYYGYGSECMDIILT